MSRTPDEILCFLIRNAKADAFLLVDGLGPPNECGAAKRLRKTDRLRNLLLRLSGPTRYTVPLPLFEAFIEERFSFEKHLRPLDVNTLRFDVAAAGLWSGIR